MAWEVLTELFTNPLFLFLFAIVAIALAIAALISTLIIAGKVSRALSAPRPPPSKPEEKPREREPVSEAKKERAKKGGEEVIRVAAGFESLQEIALLLGVDSVFLFNLNGMAIESHKVKDEPQVAASLAEFVTSLRKLGFPTETVTLKNGVKTLIISVGKVGEMEVYALMVGKADLEIDAEEARQLLNAYISDITRARKGGGGAG